jgi:hypothetical protein
MKTAACLLAVAPSLVYVLASPLEARSAEPGEALVQDAATLTSAEAPTWKSDALELQFRDGSRGKRILVLQFAPLAAEKRTDTCHAQVKLLLATPPEGPRDENSTLGDGSYRDVRLQEKEGARTITITRSLESVGRVGKNTQRNLDKFAISFTYELKDGTLTLQGFPEGPTNWGVTTFTVLQRDIAFQAGK